MSTLGRMVKQHSHLAIFVLVVIAVGAILATVKTGAVFSAPDKGEQQRSPGSIWAEIDAQSLRQGAADRRLPERYRAVRLNPEALTDVLGRAPREVQGRSVESETILSIPLPDGRFADFRIEDSEVLAPELAAQHPEIKSYRGRGVDDPGLWLRFDWTPDGFHALIISNDQTFAIHRANLSDASQYIVYSADELRAEAEDFICNVVEPDGRRLGTNRPSEARIGESISAISAPVTGPQLRTYRIAVATTQEYTNASALGGGSVASTLASINTWLNGINLVYERELSIRFVLVGTNSNVIYTAEPDPFTDGNTSAMIDEAHSALDNQIGSANYDIGHVLGTIQTAGIGAAGQAYLQVSCETGYKGRGATLIGQNGPVGNLGITGVLIHELGHQLGAGHSFNASCSNNRGSSTAWESGSGLTLMSYAGQCSPNQIVNSRSFHFHSGSIAQMSAYFNTSGGGCAAQSATGNTSPAVDGGPDYTIPRRTPFSLSGSGSDSDPADSGSLTFSWEQIDPGNSFLSPPYTDEGDPTSTTRPIFRPFDPTNSTVRTFPSLVYILNNANVPPAVVNGLQTAQNLPTVGRQLNFNLIARDGRGGTSLDSVRLTVAGNAGPFQVTQPNGGETWNGGSAQTITWNVNGTDLSPVNCAQVRILLSSDGGQTFPTVLAASTPNDGSESITIPSSPATLNGRIKIEAINNIFFDISDANFSIIPPNSCPGVTGLLQTIGNPGSQVDINGINLNGVTGVIFGGNVSASFTVVSNTRVRTTVPTGAVTGPIRLSKPNCADAVSPIFTVVSTPPVSLTLDDGSFENAYTAGGYAVNRLTPSTYPATLSAVSIFFINDAGVQTGMSIDILAGTNTDGDSNINGTAFQVTPSTVQSLNQWNVYAVPSLTITSGDFVVGFRYTPTNGVFPVAFDTTPPSSGRSYLSSDGVTFILQDSVGSQFVGDAAIRASVFQGTTPAGPVSKVGIFRSGFYWLLDSNGDRQFASPPDQAFAFGGIPGDVPITGDWNGDGRTKVGIYRPSNGLFILDYNGDAQLTGSDRVYDFGVGTSSGDTPVVGDWNGDGRAKIGLFRQGFFWILDYNGNGMFEQNLDRTYAFGGAAGDIPVVGDWTGTGTSKLGLLRQGFYWILDANGNGAFDGTGAGQDLAFAFGGVMGDVPVVGDWNGDGKTKVGMFRQGFFWVLDANGNRQFDGTGAGQDLAFPFGGLPGDRPVVGKW